MVKQITLRKPNWLKVKLPTGKAYKQVKSLVKGNSLHTICESGHCPNIGECWGEGTATFMILGNICAFTAQYAAGLEILSMACIFWIVMSVRGIWSNKNFKTEGSY